jgi:ATP-dependent DNA helicase RecQ
VLRQLIALGHLRTEGEYNTLELDPSARAVLRGEVQLLLRVPSEPAARGRKGRTRGDRGGTTKPAPIPLDPAAQARFDALKAWRGAVAREHNLPAYVVFHDATLAEMARTRPQSLDALGEISGVGARKLEAYGTEILRVVAESAAAGELGGD